MNRTTAEIWEDFSQQLRKFIAKRVADANDVEDILQDVFVKIHTNLDTLQEEDRLVPWLYHIARNATIDHYRTSRNMEELPETMAVDFEPAEAEPSALIAGSLKGMIECLPERYQQALLLSEIEGLKRAELAEMLGMSISGAKSRVQRGRDLLREALLSCCHFDFDVRGRVMDFTSRSNCY